MQTTRYLRARHSLPVESPDILHNGHRYRHVPFLPERRPAATGRIKTDWQLGNIQAAAPMPLTSPGNDDDTGENHQPTLRKNTAEPVEQTLKQNTRADPRLSDRLMNGEVPCRLTARASPFASHGPRLAGDGAHGTGARAERQTRMIGGGHMDAERDTDGTTDAHEGDHTPADGAGTEGEGGKPDTRPGDRLATIRRTLWWIGLALQLPFALTLIHFDTPYLILERILCAIPPRLASDPSSIVGIPALETEWCREFLALVLGAVCWVTAGVMRLVADSPSNHGKETLPVRIFAGIITIIVLMATGITGLFLGIAAF